MAFDKPDINSGGVDVTNEQKKRTIAALLEEKRGYENRALKAEEDGDDEALEIANDRVKAVEAELRKLGASAKRGSETAEKRPSSKVLSSR